MPILPCDESKITKHKQWNIFFDIFVFQTEVCTSVRLSGCKEIDAVSEELKSIYHSRKVRIPKDVDLTVDIMEKIVKYITENENVNKTPQVKSTSVNIWAALYWDCLDTESFLLHCKSLLSVGDRYKADQKNLLTLVNSQRTSIKSI